MAGVIRYLYTFEYQKEEEQLDWLSHVKIYITSKKYLLDQLTSKALGNVRSLAKDLNRIGDGAEIWRFICCVSDQDDALMAIAAKLQAHNMGILLRESEFRKKLDDDAGLLEECAALLQSRLSQSKPVQIDMVEAQVSKCNSCQSSLLQTKGRAPYCKRRACMSPAGIIVTACYMDKIAATGLSIGAF